jgi:CMP-N-acetylneuraminic acid synthetase
MIGDKRILVVVPARGGSKGIPMKNLRSVGGVPMVARVGAVLRKLPMIDRAVVSTDHEEIARVAESAGIAAPFRRPPELSGDRIGDLDVLSHALLEMEAQDKVVYDIVVMLQPTSPLRQPNHVRAAVSMLVEKVEATFVKKATGTIFFTCEDGKAMEAIVDETVKTGEGVKLTSKAIGKNLDGVIVAEFTFTWSFKAKSE